VTVAEALALGTVRLREAGIESAGHDAEVLLRHVLGGDRARLLVDAGRALEPESEASFLGLLTARAARRPLQHLTGTQWFWRHEFLVTPDVLIPRPETELIVETALDLLRNVPTPVIADVGTGSGCIALSLAAERPDAVVSGIDISPAALAVARQNASRLSLEGRLRFLQGDLLEPLREGFGGIDMVVSNPPYVDPDEAPGLTPEVRLHEPAPALYPPSERYSVYRRLAPQAAVALRPGGTLLLEVGRAMRDEVVRICEGAGLRVESVIPDLQGIPRTVVTRKPAGYP
jgi:release factor glutamine methyltransferase